MARLSTDGLDDFENQIRKIEAGLRGEAITAMLTAGGEVLKRSWEDKIGEYHHVRTGAMQQSVGITPVRYDGDGAYVEVYPMGTDSHRVTNAQKAFILHHGRSPKRIGTKGIKGDKFVTKAERDATAAANAAMQQKLNEYIAGKE